MDLDESLKSVNGGGNPNRGGAISPAKFFGEDRYQKYLDEITASGTLEGQQLSPSERKEAFKKRNDKIGFKNFVDKVLAKKQSATTSISDSSNAKRLTGGGALVKSPAAPLAKFVKSPVSEEAQENLDDISKGIDSILNTLRQKDKLEKKSKETERRVKEKEGRGKKEKQLESKAFKGLGKVIDNVISPVKSLFEKLFEFLSTLLIGRILVKFVDWFSDPENKGKLEAIGRFLKDTWPALLVAYLAFGTGIGRFITKLGFMIGGWIVKLSRFVIPKLLGFVSKHPLVAAGVLIGGATLGAYLWKENEEEKQVEREAKERNVDPEQVKKEVEDSKKSAFAMFGEAMQNVGTMGFSNGGFVPRGTDTVPAMLTPGEFVMSRGAVNMFGPSTLSAMNAAGGGSNRPRYYSSGGPIYAQGGGYVGEKKNEMPPEHDKLMEKRVERPWWDKAGWFGGAAAAKQRQEKSKTKNSKETKSVSAKGGGSITDIQRQALGILAKYESGAAGYNAVNQIGVAGGRGVKGFSGDIRKMTQHKGRPLTDFTIAEIKRLQHDDRTMSDDQWIKAGKLHAVGKYQFIGNTLPGVAKRAGIPDNAKFSEGVQDLMALQLMKERGISPWVGPSDKATAAERAIIAQARGQDIKFDPSMPTGSIADVGGGVDYAGIGGVSGGGEASPPPRQLKTTVAQMRAAVNFVPAKSAPSIGMPVEQVQSFNSKLADIRAAINGGAPKTPAPSNSIPNFDAAIMHDSAKVKTLGVG